MRGGEKKKDNDEGQKESSNNNNNKKDIFEAVENFVAFKMLNKIIVSNFSDLLYISAMYNQDKFISV